jgi:NAD(P)-dependent dehydrogenase (short-subunit alcohol dehydrogenase family)
MRKLAGKNILITSASQGLGREMALRFAREGAAELSLVARHVDELNKVRDQVRKIAPKIEVRTSVKRRWVKSSPSAFRLTPGSGDLRVKGPTMDQA